MSCVGEQQGSAPGSSTAEGCSPLGSGLSRAVRWESPLVSTFDTVLWIPSRIRKTMRQRLAHLASREANLWIWCRLASSRSSTSPRIVRTGRRIACQSSALQVRKPALQDASTEEQRPDLGRGQQFQAPAWVPRPVLQGQVTDAWSCEYRSVDSWDREPALLCGTYCPFQA